jgi:signal transduction histidine kinase/outer membrane murein-binding lipoprotein Lpp
MRFKTWPVAAVALGGLLLLVGLSVLAASRKAQEIYTQVEELNSQYLEVETKLSRLRSDVHASGIFVRDYLLDAARERAPEYRQTIADYRQSNRVTFIELRKLSQGRVGSSEQLSSLEAMLDEYWQTFDPLFDWTPAEKISQSASFLRREVIPRRDAVMAIAQEIEELNNASLTAQRAEVARRHAAFRSDLFRLLWRSVLLGILVAVLAVIRLRVLERRSDEQRSIAQVAERQLRQLSQQLVATQEEERKKLSRELHDHVGQMLTALRMELGRVDRLRSSTDTRLADAVAASRQLVDDMVRTVRDLALGLRPSMLDDFGLQAALEWHVRDFSRRYGLPAQLDVDGDLDHLPDAHRTCVYRVVQEALTNCIRHAAPKRIDVRVRGKVGALEVVIADDGVGFDPESRPSGLGLRGIEERVRELEGTMTLRTAAGAGTTLTIRLPLGASSEEVLLARAAG